MSVGMKSSPWSSRPVSKPPEAVHKAIPILHETNNNSSSPGVRNGRPTKMATMEKRMEDEVEDVLKNWDGNVKCRKQETISLRPRSGERTRRKRGSNPHATPTRQSVTSPGRSPRHVVFPEIDVIKREDESFDTSSESLGDGEAGGGDGSGKSPHYTDCPDTGHRLFRMEFDAPGYEQENISVKIQGSRLVVHAIKKENVEGRKTTNQLCRKIKLPSDIERDKLRCAYVSGKIVIEAPTAPDIRHQQQADVLPLSSKTHGNPTYLITPKSDPKNVPMFKDSPKGLELYLLADIGRVFKADDVIVKVKGQDRLLITAKREEENTSDRLTAALTREFDLTEKVVPTSLRAGLTMDGVLKITATVDREINVSGSAQESAVNGGSAPDGPRVNGAAEMNGARANGV